MEGRHVSRIFWHMQAVARESVFGWQRRRFSCRYGDIFFWRRGFLGEQAAGGCRKRGGIFWRCSLVWGGSKFFSESFWAGYREEERRVRYFERYFLWLGGQGKRGEDFSLKVSCLQRRKGKLYRGKRGSLGEWGFWGCWSEIFWVSWLQRYFWDWLLGRGSFLREITRERVRERAVRLESRGGWLCWFISFVGFGGGFKRFEAEQDLTGKGLSQVWMQQILGPYLISFPLFLRDTNKDYGI